MIAYREILKKTRPYQTVLHDKQKGNLNHCYMVVTEDEIACNNLALMLAEIIICKDDGCGECPTCIRIEDNNYQELKVLEDYSKQGLVDFISEADYCISEGTYKVMLIKNFEKIDRTQQNTLLKRLEEPAENVIYILGVCRVANVLQTVLSRSKKLYMEKFDEEDIRYALSESEADEMYIDRAVECCFGDLTKAIKLSSDLEFNNAYQQMLYVLFSMKTSRDVPSMINALELKNIGIEKYLDVLDIMLKGLLMRINNVNTKAFYDLKRLDDIYNNAMLVNIAKLVRECRKRVESNCKPEAIADYLLLGILEVKYLCQL